MRLIRIWISVALFSLSLPIVADVYFNVPIVTQVQGVAFYRTSLAISNVGPGSLVALIFFYRSPVDNTMQAASVVLPPLATSTAFSSDDIVQFLKTNSDMRAADKAAALFGSLQVELPGVTDPTDVTIVARTYSPGPGGNGTMGIAYNGRPNSPTTRAFSRMTTTVRNGTFGQDGNARANIGMMNLSNGDPLDLKIEYRDATTGVSLKSFTLSSVAGHSLAAQEVVQLGNVFSDPALAGSSRIVVIVTPNGPSQSFTGYVVQLDNTTNDGSFFLMTEK